MHEQNSKDTSLAASSLHVSEVLSELRYVAQELLDERSSTEATYEEAYRFVFKSKAAVYWDNLETAIAHANAILLLSSSDSSK